MDVDTLRLPPQSIESEQAVIGALLIDNRAWDQVADLLQSGDFYRHEHRVLYEHLRSMLVKGLPADSVTLMESLNRASALEEAGGLAYINTLAQNTPSAANVSRYAAIVRDKAILRRVIATSDEIATLALDAKAHEAREVLDVVESKIFAIGQDAQRGRAEFALMPSMTGKWLEELQQRYDAGPSKGLTGVSTGFIDLDRMTNGLQRGDLVVVAGRPSMGKTALALNMAEHLAVDRRQPVAVFSMEMGAEQLHQRTIASLGRVDATRLRTAQLVDSDWPRITDAASKLADAPLWVDDSGGLTPVDLRARARRLARRCGGLSLVVVDYLQLMSTSSSGENRATEIAEISRALKGLAKELNCPVVVLSQLNREVEKRVDKRPMMSDLRESGAIEQDADVILMIYRDEFYNPDTADKGIAEVLIAKQRNGPTGRVLLAFRGEYNRFDNANSLV